MADVHGKDARAAFLQSLFADVVSRPFGHVSGTERGSTGSLKAGDRPRFPKLRVVGSSPIVRFGSTKPKPAYGAGFGVSRAGSTLPPETAKDRSRLARTGAKLAHA